MLESIFYNSYTAITTHVYMALFCFFFEHIQTFFTIVKIKLFDHEKFKGKLNF